MTLILKHLWPQTRKLLCPQNFSNSKSSPTHERLCSLERLWLINISDPFNDPSYFLQRTTETTYTTSFTTSNLVHNLHPYLPISRSRSTDLRNPISSSRATNCLQSIQLSPCRRPRCCWTQAAVLASWLRCVWGQVCPPACSSDRASW